MRYAFLGTPEFAAMILEGLIKGGMPPSLVITNPDRPVGRKNVITPPPVKQSIMEKVVSSKDTITILQPENPKDVYTLLRSTNYDFFVVAAYGRIIPKEIFDIPRLGTIGVHPSLLPKYRGASPIQSAILGGDKETGVTLFIIDEKVDHGAIVSDIKYQVSSSDTYKTLEQKLAALSVQLLIETLPKFVKGEIVPQLQDESKATYTKKFETQDAFVDLAKDEPMTIWRKVRALNPEPGVYTIMTQKESGLIPANGRIVGKRMKILEANLENGKLILKKIQFAGQKPRSA